MSNDIGFAVSEFRIGSGRVLYCGSTHYSDLMGSHWRMPCSNDAEAHAELRKYRRQEIDPESPWPP